MLCASPLPLCSFCLEMVSMTMGKEQLQSWNVVTSSISVSFSWQEAQNSNAHLQLPINASSCWQRAYKCFCTDFELLVACCGGCFFDCIGSAFNSKGTMQCPNCRQVEDGEWLYANGCCRYYEEEAIHRNFVYAQDADQSYQPRVWWLLPYAA